MYKQTKRKVVISVGLSIVTLAGAFAMAQEAPARIEGEVVRLMQQTRAGDYGNLDAVMIRTRQGNQMRLLLGEAGGCSDCVRVGDRIQARLNKGGSPETGYQVRSMTVERTRERIRFRDSSGQLLQAQARDRSTVNDRTQSRDRIHEPGTGGGAGGGSRGGGRGRGR